MQEDERLPIAIGDIEEAARRIAGVAVRTPLLRSPLLDEITGGRILLKLEILQRTGSFKFRGAYNKIASLDPQVRARGVVAWSSGNHAQGVAAAAALFGIPAAIVMPQDAPSAKLERTRALGAEIVLHDRWTQSREDIGSELAGKRGATIVRPFNDPLVMAGQGTAGLELAQDAAALGLSIDDALAPCSGGGLIAGVSTAVAARFPDARFWSVEPAGFDDNARSLAAGERVANKMDRRSICDSLLAPITGDLTFAVNRKLLSGGLVVTDEEALATVGFAARELKLVVEPGGATALAAVLTGKLPVRGRTVGVVVSGGNIDADMLARALASPPPTSAAA